eukprot:CAMPEP_0177646202 /NCGR_PEP_ID=MMETSP0447-20121125/9651_1 /TAXON_ID=0 /ORGANISM="Stygamoeba regulata, Strain BSH-02190019" /LENGTH=154 /DNA_ID=CAMNT_0019148725 /DNA_START=125 /DNA_END=589 /DNA_ORIENTATION=-
MSDITQHSSEPKSKFYTPELVIKFVSSRSFDEVCALLEETAPKHKFGVMHSHAITKILQSKGVTDFTRPLKVYEICNPHYAAKVLNAEIHISSMLPCRISVFESEQDDGSKHTVLSTVKPTKALVMFGPNSERAMETAQEVEDAMTNIMREAAQ